jgi:histidinol-phosphate aminotransferase
LTSLKFWPSAANFVYGCADSEAQSAALGQALKQLGTSIRTTGGGLRITVGSPAENDRTLQRLQHCVREI